MKSSLTLGSLLLWGGLIQGLLGSKALWARNELARDQDLSATTENGVDVFLNVRKKSLNLYYGGEAEYRLLAQPHEDLVQALFRGEELLLEPVGGYHIEELSKSFRIRLSLPNENERRPYEYIIRGTNDEGLKFKNLVFQEIRPPERVFSLVTYNVENLFDQKDEDRNQSYGDYRINPNRSGQYSNYGEKVYYEGLELSFTQVKIKGIRKTLTALDPSGPDIVGLQEIESRQAAEELFAELSDLGYQSLAFTDWPRFMGPIAVGQAVIAKFPLLSQELLAVEDPIHDGYLRPILKVTFNVEGHPFYVYNSHWKSKGGPESMRMASAEVIKADIDQILSKDPDAEYAVVGDLNSNYNESSRLHPKHNDTEGLTGINDVLKAQGEANNLLNAPSGSFHYDLYYELAPQQRKSAFHKGFGWSSMDHIILGKGAFDEKGVSYISNSFYIPRPEMPSLKFLFNEHGTTNRWWSKRRGRYTEHRAGGYSDHLPLFARFRVKKR